MHQVQIYDDLYQLPSDWDELTPKQMAYIVKLTLQDTPLERVKIHLLLYCLKARVDRHRKIFGDKVRLSVGKESERVRFCIRRKRYLLTPEEVNSLANIFGFLFENEVNQYGRTTGFYIKPDRRANPYPVLWVRGRKFIGPDDCLFDISFEQFMYMQTYQDALRHVPKQLSHLLACLWHRGKEFDINRLDKDAALLSHLPTTKKMMLYWFIAGCMAYLAASFSRVFSGEGKVSNNVFDSQLRLLDTLANSDMTKKDAVRKGRLLDALYSMDEFIRRGDEMEERLR